MKQKKIQQRNSMKLKVSYLKRLTKRKILLDGLQKKEKRTKLLKP